MAFTESQRVLYVEDFSRDHLVIQQFGQANDSIFYNGATACAAACLQFLTLLWTGRFYTLNRIAQIAGFPETYAQRHGQSGMNTTQIMRYCRAVGLPYMLVFRWDASAIMRAANTRGPVFFGHAYGWNPEWKDYRYAGRLADGSPNGFASPLRKAGKTQLSGFERGPHAGMHLGYLVRRPAGSTTLVLGRDHRIREPNHGSPARPQRPAHSVISDAQWKKLCPSLSYVGRTPFALVPTRAFNGR